MNREDIIRMAREVGAVVGVKHILDCDGDGIHFAPEELERFAALVAAAEREVMYKRRGTIMFDPYAGTPRHPSDIASDPHAILLLDPEQPIRAWRQA